MTTKTTFDMGKLVFTCGVMDTVEQDATFAKGVHKSLARHQKCDWGELDEEDKKSNDEALKADDGRLFSAYDLEGDLKIWIITEHDRSSTCVLFPHEY